MSKDGSSDHISLARFAQLISNYHANKTNNDNKHYFVLLSCFMCLDIVNESDYVMREKMDQQFLDNMKFIIEKLLNNEGKEAYKKKLDEIGKKFPISQNLFIQLYCKYCDK